jgi:isopentenyldiphosphate isomerase
MSEFCVVNEQDEILRYDSKENIARKEIYRVAALWISNSEGKILLARRAITKTHNPGQWGPSAAGTVEKGETYESNIIKEAEEELGLKNIKPAKGPKFLRDDNKRRHFTQWFFLTLNKPESYFTLQEEEVAEVRWFTKKELEQEIEKHPEDFLPNMKSNLEKFSVI